MALAAHNLKWNLDNIFSDLEGDKSFSRHLDSIRSNMELLKTALINNNLDESLARWQMASASLRQGFSYVACLGIEDPHLPELQNHQTQLIALERIFSELSIKIEFLWAKATDSHFESWVSKREYKILAPIIRYRRGVMVRRMSLEKEQFALSLAREVFWPLTDVYRAVVSRLAVIAPGMGVMDIFTAQSKLRSSPASERETLFRSYESAWHKQGCIFSTLINQIYGYRLEILHQRKQQDPLEESLIYHRVSRSSVEALWNVVNDRKASLILFLSKKARLYNRQRALWSDIWAEPEQPNRTTLSLKEAGEWVFAAMSRIGGEVADFCRLLSSTGCIQNQGNSSVAVSSFTLPLPLQRQVRVFLGYSDGADRITDYARQMVCAWRYHLLFDQPELAQNVPLVVIEALSAFAERLVLEVVSERAYTRQLQFDAIFSHMQRALTYVLDMQVRFLFETRLFALRAQGSISQEKLCEVMTECQRIAYAGQLANYFPYYWASKEHFYHTKSSSFENYPLSMGFLLGLGLYQMYCDQPQGFCDKLTNWVRMSAACVSLESLTYEIFGTKIETNVLWDHAMSILESDMRSLGNLMDTKDKTFSLEMKSY